MYNLNTRPLLTRNKVYATAGTNTVMFLAANPRRFLGCSYPASCYLVGSNIPREIPTSASDVLPCKSCATAHLKNTLSLHITSRHDVKWVQIAYVGTVRNWLSRSTFWNNTL